MDAVDVATMRDSSSHSSLGGAVAGQTTPDQELTHDPVRYPLHAKTFGEEMLAAQALTAEITATAPSRACQHVDLRSQRDLARMTHAYQWLSIDPKVLQQHDQSPYRLPHSLPFWFCVVDGNVDSSVSRVESRW